MRQLAVGQTVNLGWNSAKSVDEGLAYTADITVEALGPGWAVFRRTSNRMPYAVTWTDARDEAEFMKEVTVL